MFGRDKTSLSGRLHRLSEGVFKHRAFRLVTIIARSQAGESSPISWPGLALGTTQAGTSTTSPRKRSVPPLTSRPSRVARSRQAGRRAGPAAAPPAPAGAGRVQFAQARAGFHLLGSLASGPSPSASSSRKRSVPSPTSWPGQLIRSHRPGQDQTPHRAPPASGEGGAPRRTPPRSIPQASTPSQRNQASTSGQGTGQDQAAGALGAGAGTESRPKADRLRGIEGREQLSMNELLSLLSYLSPQSPRIVPTLSPHPLSPSHPLSIGVLSRSGHLSPRPHKN